MLARSLLLLSALALSSCCAPVECTDGFSWVAPLPEPWTAEEVEAGRVQLCVNGACEERPFAADFVRVGEVLHGSDGSLSIRVGWSVEVDETPLAYGDLVSLTLLAADGTVIAGIAESAVAYQVTNQCDDPTCRHAYLVGSTL